ncbi:uncharacterized protein N7482_001039 [Penicillium canariense]|uniref:Fungal N-terminal domain-containing protein n=1 Tax=Penicillium canariense TaxID=189055 RepID=A0A9W9IEW9_9EURO|nr:uncharacterized protein N7482_001039 [Penicillium canariense]KAJ5175162.1 hypothetical protein N7482_001039 [Penicillium canariense]
MSGLEVIGVVASILQIADLGAKLSVKLCSFYRTVKDANKSMQSLSSDVSLTCSILQELGRVLEQDEQTKLCSQKAFGTAQEVLTECKAAFETIDSAMEKQRQEGARNPVLRGARKITVAFMGPNLDLLRSNLERLKSTMLLMLHVIMYAGQLRQKVVHTPLTNPRGLIQTLIEEKKTNDAKFDRLTRSIEAVKLNSNGPILTAQQTSSTPGSDEELEKYYGLVWKLLHEIDSCQESLEKSRHLRMRNGVVNLHSAEAAIMKHTHGDSFICSYEEAFSFSAGPTPKIPGRIRETQFPGQKVTREKSPPVPRRPLKRREQERLVYRFGGGSETVCITPFDRDAYLSEYVVNGENTGDSELDRDDYYYRRHRRPRPDDSVIASRLQGGHDEVYSSGDSRFLRRERWERDDEEVYRKRHIDEGALAGARVAKVIRNHRKREDEQEPNVHRADRPFADPVLSTTPLVRANKVREDQRNPRAIHYDSDSIGRSPHHNHRRRGRNSRSRSRSRSWSRPRSRSRRYIASSETDSAPNGDDNRRVVARAGLAGAAVAGLVERARSRSRQRRYERERSCSRRRQGVPIATAGLGTAAIVALFAKRKAKRQRQSESPKPPHRALSGPVPEVSRGNSEESSFTGDDIKDEAVEKEPVEEPVEERHPEQISTVSLDEFMLQWTTLSREEIVVE